MDIPSILRLYNWMIKVNVGFIPALWKAVQYYEEDDIKPKYKFPNGQPY